MKVQTIASSKNPYMWIGIVIMFAILSTVIPSSTMNTSTAKNMIFQGVRYTRLSLIGVLNSFMNNATAIITSPRLYNGAASARLNPKLILRNLLLCQFVLSTPI